MTDGADLAQLIEQAGDQPLTVASAGAGLWAISKVVGPSLDAIGASLGRFTERRLGNIESLGRRIAARQDERQFAELHPAHPRLAHLVIDEASWCDDEIMQEYFAGILLTSMEAGGVDDFSGYVARIVAMMHPGALRLHHALYATMLARAGMDEVGSKRGPLRTFVALDEASRVTEEGGYIEAVAALAREGLIDTYRSTEEAAPFWWAPGPGLVLTPSFLGLGVFAMAYGIDAGPMAVGELDELPSIEGELPLFANWTSAPVGSSDFDDELRGSEKS